VRKKIGNERKKERRKRKSEKEPNEKVLEIRRKQIRAP